MWSRRRFRMLMLGVAAALVLVALGFTLFQHRLIYYGRPYDPAVRNALPGGLTALSYHSSQGEQVAFYRGPRDGSEPTVIWMVFSGNGSHALQWVGALDAYGGAQTAWFLLDYPGFGFSQGSPTPGRILESSAAAVEALRLHLDMQVDALQAKLAIFGHSLGAATALQHAAKHPVQRIVIAAPFTNLVEMGHRTFFWPCGHVLWHRFDNEARLAEIAAQHPRPSLQIWHGAHDDTCTPDMFARLIAPYPDWIDGRLMQDSDHDNIVVHALQAMRPP